MGDLTIGELARLLGVSIHQVRYWEAHNLLTPLRRGSNGYRQYGWDSVYRAAQVKLLRNLGVPAGRIGTLGTQEVNGTRSILEASVRQAEAEVEDLRRLIDTANRILANERSDHRKWVSRDLAEVSLAFCLTLDQPEFDLRSFARHCPPNGDLASQDLVLLVTSGSTKVYLTATQPADLTLGSGTHQTYRFVADDETSVETGVREAFGQPGAPAADFYAIVELTAESLLCAGGMVYEVRVPRLPW